MQYNFIKDNLSGFSVEEMCECFGLSRSGYYDWSQRSASSRAIEDEKLKHASRPCIKRLRGATGIVRFTSIYRMNRQDVGEIERFV